VIVKRCGAVFAVALLFAACGATGPTPTPPPGPTPTPTAPPAAPAGVTAANATGFPYAAGTQVTTGSKGLHDDNFVCLDNQVTGEKCTTGAYTLAGAGSSGVGTASLDLLAPKGTPVIPLAPGTVLAASPLCQTILVDHGSGVWVEYVHIIPSVSAGQGVVRSKPMGTVAPAWPAPKYTGPCGLYADAPHVHFAFLQGDDTSKTGTYVTMAGVLICSHAVTATGGFEGLPATGPDMAFTVPSCPIDGSTAVVVPTPTPTPSPTATATPTPTPTPTATPAPTAPPKPGNPNWSQPTFSYKPSPGTNGLTTETHKATWSEPKGAATKFLIYGVLGCLRAATAADGQPCVVLGMAIPKSSLVLLASAPGSARSAKVSWTEPAEAGPPTYGSFLIRAVNDTGMSKFTILYAGSVCNQCTY
jgi:murein DD-endopeptidase MepM/ murein hydrolase activator NlpD